MTVNRQYRVLNPSGATPREISEVVNNAMNGKTNNTGIIALNTGWATTTTIYDERIGYDSIILLATDSDSSEADTLPYGSFSNNNGQTASSVGSTAVIEFDSTEQSNGVYLDSTTKIYVRNTGVYNVQYSLQLANNANDQQYADVWFRINGTDVTHSSSRFSLQARPNANDPSFLIGSMNIFLEMDAGDYFEIAGSVSSTDVVLYYIAADTGLPRPATPAVITTVTFVAPSSVDNVYISSQTKGEATITHFANNTSDKTYKYLVVG